MREWKTGELVWVHPGSILENFVSNEQGWNDRAQLALVVGTYHQIVEDEETVDTLKIVLVNGTEFKGLYRVFNRCLLDPSDIQQARDNWKAKRFKEG